MTSTEDMGGAEAAPSPGRNPAVPVEQDQRGVPAGHGQPAAPAEQPAAPAEQPAAAAGQPAFPDQRTEAGQEQRRQWRQALTGMLLPAIFVIGFAFAYISAFHEPTPHGVKVAVVGPAAETAPLRASLAKAAGQAFDVRAAPTPAAAAREVYDKDLYGAYVPPPRPHGTAIAIVNSASGGPQVATAVESLTRGVAMKQGAALAVRDVRPLPAGDRNGTSLFYYLIICTLAGVLTVTILGQAAPTLRPQRRYLLILGAAVGAPVVAYLIGGPLMGAYTGSAGTVFALIEMGALYAFIVALIARGLQVGLGRQAGLIAALVIFVILNFPSTGGAVPAPLLPAFWRFVNHFWIGAAAEDAFHSIVYLSGHGVATDLYKLLGWIALAAALFAVAAWRKRARNQRRPARSPEPERQH